MTQILIPNKEIITSDKFNEEYHFFIKPNSYDMTTRRLEERKKYADFVQWGRRNPVQFAEEIFGVEFLDYQRYVFASSWNTPYVVWCMGRNSGKSILGAIFIMTKTLLVPNHTSYILCGVGSQSIELFTKIEKFTKGEIDSFDQLTDIFQGELVKSQANSDGFTHNPASYKFHLYNGSSVFTLNGAFDNNRSKRSNLNFYDECMNSPDELFITSEPFTTQNSKFKMGKNYSEEKLLSTPDPFPNQLIYASSAGRTDQYFFKKYREASIHMDAGDPRYFCADISSDVVLTATSHGKVWPIPLLTQETIDARMREDKEAGLREYKNIFTSEGGDGQIISRALIIRNSVNRTPILKNDLSDSRYAIAYDPARSYDNSVIAIGQYYKDPIVGWKMRIANVVNLQDVFKKTKTPMNTPNQIKKLKQIIIDYNGEEVADYENISKILIDAGSGGAGVNIADFFMEDWYEPGHENDLKYLHRGLVDKEYSEEEARNFPNAIKDVIRLVSPSKYKSELYESMIEMMNLNLVEFPNAYDDRGYIHLIYEINSKGIRTQRYTFPSEKEEKELAKKGITVETQIYHLDKAEETALKQIDAMKTEVVNMYRFKQASGKDRFDLAPDKIGKLNDDRSYCCALLCWHLSQLRRKEIINKPKQKSNRPAFKISKEPKRWGKY